MPHPASPRRLTPLAELALAFAFGLALPLVSIAAIAWAGLPFASDQGSGDYIGPVIGYLQTGTWGVDGETDLDRLPGYLLFLAGIYSAFGIGNDLAVVLVQAVMVSATVVLIGLAARAIRHEWMWPAVIIAGLTPNIGYRASVVMSEPLFAFGIAATLCGALWAIRGERPWLFSFLGAAGAALCFVTRPAFLAFPVLTAPFLFLAFRRAKVGRGNAAVLAVLPLVLSFVVSVPQVAKGYRETGQFSFTTQSGKHLMNWVYPCLAAATGCGQRDAEALQRAGAAYQAALEQLPDAERDNPVSRARVRDQVGRELVLTLPPQRLAVAAIGGYAKLLLHSVVYEIQQRAGIVSIYLSQVPGATLPARAINLLAFAVTYPAMGFWLVAQAALFAMRLLQLAGLVVGLRSREYRAAALYLAVGCMALAGITVGLGNPRYRVGIEPALVLFAIFGWQALRELGGRLFTTTAARPAAVKVQ